MAWQPLSCKQITVSSSLKMCLLQFVKATGETTTAREFFELAFSHLGITLQWEGKGVNEIGILDDIDADQFESTTDLLTSDLQLSTEKALIKVNPQYFRPTEVETLLGELSKAQKKLGWKFN